MSDTANGQKSFTLDIPLVNSGDGKPLPIELRRGETLFLLGANGSGKSSLLAKWQKEINASYRIAANRSLFFNDTEVHAQRNTPYNEKQERHDSFLARWNMQYAWAKHSFIIAKLINNFEWRNQHITEALDNNKAAPNIQNIFSKINNLLKQANISIKFSLDEKRDLVAIHTDTKDQKEYSLAKTSEGERATILIAAEILLAENNRLFLIDEPERHLQRSISAPLLKTLFAERPDCAFVISTHDISLVREIENAKILLLRNCRYEDEYAIAWDADLIENPAEIPEDIQTAILGARRKVLFVEGETDKKLYQIFFPDWDIIEAGNCGKVIDNLQWLNDAKNKDTHRLTASGIIDNDGRSDDQRADFINNGIYVLPNNAYAVESIYYDFELLGKIAEKQASELDKNAKEFMRSAEENLLKIDIKSVSAQKILKQVSDNFKSSQPKTKEIYDEKRHKAWKEKAVSKIESIPARFQEEEQKLRKLCEDRNIESIIAHYPIKSVTTPIAKALHYLNERDYEATVCSYLKKNPNEVQRLLKKYFADLVGKMNDEKLPF